MNYCKESKQIIEKIDASQKILLVVHRGPDPDSVGSNLAMYHALHSMGKKDVTIISEDKPPLSLNFLPGIEKIEVVDMGTFDFSSFQLFIALDMGELGMITSTPGIPRVSGNIPIMAIDHHRTNTMYGEINLVDDNIGSTGELLYNLFGEWEVEIDKEIAISLFAAIAGDTGVFRYASVTAETLKIAALLLEAGANLADVTFNFYQRNTPQTLHFWGKVLEKIEITSQGKYKFAWAALPFEEFEALGRPSARDSAASMFFQGIEGTDFGLLVVEETKGIVKGSLRSRSEIDVSAIAKVLGGGGHRAAAGFRVYGDFGKATKEIKETLVRYLEQHEK